MEGNEKKENKKIKGKKVLKENWLLIILFFITTGVILLNNYDKKNSETISVVVDTNLIKTTGNNEKESEKLKIFIYNKDVKKVEEKEVYTSKGVNLIEGDYINEIIKNTTFLTDKMKFISAYNVELDGKKTLIVKLNSEFLPLKLDKELFEGFSQSIMDTMKNYNSNLENIQIQIDGDKFSQ